MLATVLFLTVLALAAASVPPLGGRLALLGELRLERIGVVLAALALQLVTLTVLADGNRVLVGLAYSATFVLAGVFVWSNRRAPGLPVIALGGAMNAFVIAINGGQMPARAGALEAAGRPLVEDGFRNSALIADPHLPWLGDTFAIPAGVPLSNVFSLGDVVLAVGTVSLVHGACGSRLAAAVRLPGRARSQEPASR